MNFPSHPVPGVLALFEHVLHLEVREYDLQPADWFCVADSATDLASWYPVEYGMSSPSIYIKVATKTRAGRLLLEHYNATLKLLSDGHFHFDLPGEGSHQNSSGKTFDDRTLEAPASHSLEKGLVYMCD